MEGGNKSLRKKELVFLFLMALPTFGIALSYTLIGTYLPIFIVRISNAAMTGMMIGSEGLFAFIIPTIVGQWSDAMKSYMGKRFPFIFFALGLIVLALLLMPFSSNSLLLLWIEIAIFFSGYFTYYVAYYGLYSDLVPKWQSGRSQGFQASLRAIGMMFAMGGGGFLISIWQPLPFIIAAFLITTATLILYFAIRGRIIDTTEESMKIQWLGIFHLLKGNKKIRSWFYANSLWEASVNILKAFIVLYFMKGIGFTLYQTSATLIFVGISSLIAAPISGIIADRHGYKKIIFTSALLFGLGLLPPLFFFNPYGMVGIVPVAIIAGLLMALPFGLLMHLLPEKEHHGIGGALNNISQGIGAILGPFSAGYLVDLTKDWDFLMFQASHGYSVIFLFASLFVLLSLIFLPPIFKSKPR